MVEIVGWLVVAAAATATTVPPLLLKMILLLLYFVGSLWPGFIFHNMYEYNNSVYFFSFLHFFQFSFGSKVKGISLVAVDVVICKSVCVLLVSCNLVVGGVGSY